MYSYKLILAVITSICSICLRNASCEDITAASCYTNELAGIRNVSFAEIYRNYTGVQPDNSQIPTELGSGTDKSNPLTSIIQGTTKMINNTLSSLNMSESALKNRIRYLLFTNKNQNQYQVLPEDGTVKGIVDWDAQRKTKVVIHGLNPYVGFSPEVSIWIQHIFEIKDAYVKLDPSKVSYNVIVMDWTPLATQLVTNYPEAANATRPAGEDLAGFLIKLKNSGNIRSWDDVHIVGHSLGAHVSGVAGNRIQMLAKSTIPRITGLDPAGLCFDAGDGKLATDTSGTLDKTDAKFVDIIHTNSGNLINSVMARYGTIVQSGHADFYPNGGEVQPGCNSEDDRVQFCSHQRSVVYFAKSISLDKFASCPCASWSAFSSKECSCDANTEKLMGESCDTAASGRYYLNLS